jgi:iron-sulfur cluster repair protein YtfE (RIC family)
MRDPRETRAELLAQHGEIRKLLAYAATIAADLLKGMPVESRFEQAMVAVRAALLRHNQQEEAMLVPLLAGRDRWSAQRIARMVEEHTGEHATIQRMLVGPALEVADRLGELIEDLDAHMAAEERTVLNPTVLGGRDH